MPSAIQRLEAAVARRISLRAGGTDAVRLCNGAGDGLDGIWIDDLAGHWLVHTCAPSIPQWLVGFPGYRTLHWRTLDRSSRSAPRQVDGPPLVGRFEVRECGLRFWIDLGVGSAPGLFLDQRGNRAEVRAFARPGGRVLNCFAFTCGFSLGAAVAGAQASSVDLSPRALAWGRDNFLLNGVAVDAHRFEDGDAMACMRRLARRGERFDLVILDPPTFARGRSGGTFRVARDLSALVRVAGRDLLSAQGRLLCCTNQRTLAEAAFLRLVRSGLDNPRAWRLSCRPMPADFPGEQYLKSVWVEP